MNKKTAEYIKTLIAENEFQLKCEKRSFDINCKQLGRITNPTYLYECDRCDEKIYCDDDITPDCVYLDPDITEFFDGSYRVHYKCLTESEKKCMEKNNANKELALIKDAYSSLNKIIEEAK